MLQAQSLLFNKQKQSKAAPTGPELDVDVNRAAAVLAVLTLLGGGLEAMRVGGRVWCVLKDDPAKLRMGAGDSSEKKDDVSKNSEESVVEGVLVHYGRDPLAPSFESNVEDVAYVAIPSSLVGDEVESNRQDGNGSSEESLALAPIRLPASCVQPMGGGADNASDCGKLMAALRQPEVARHLGRAFESLLQAETEPENLDNADGGGLESRSLSKTRSAEAGNQMSESMPAAPLMERKGSKRRSEEGSSTESIEGGRWHCPKL